MTQENPNLSTGTQVTSELDKIKISTSIETAKQLIWICSGLIVVIVTTLSNFLNNNNLKLFVAIAAISTILLLILTIYFSIYFFLALIARVGYHKDTNIFNEVPKKDMKFSINSFIAALAFLLITIVIALIGFQYSEQNKISKIDIETSRVKVYSTNDSILVIEKVDVNDIFDKRCIIKCECYEKDTTNIPCEPQKNNKLKKKNGG